MSQISVVIITKNEACNIADCILSAKKISNDVIVIDSGSTDETVSTAREAGARVEYIFWQGYGYARNTGAALAAYDHILSLDADERITDELAALILALDFNDARIVYGFKRINYFGAAKIKYGALAHDRVYRLYNKSGNRWNTVPVHETITGKEIKKVTLSACALHFGIKDEERFFQKKMHYANLCAYKYLLEKKKYIFIRGGLSPVFNFIKTYIFQAGFLDGADGFAVARINFIYIRRKYRRLTNLIAEEKRHEQRMSYLKTSFQKIISSFF